MTVPDFLNEDARGYIRLTGHRIGLFHVVDHYRRGLTAQQIEEEYDTLPLALIEQVLAFYRANQAEVDAYCDRTIENIERQQAEPRRGPSLEELERRMEARRKSQSA